MSDDEFDAKDGDEKEIPDGFHEVGGDDDDFIGGDDPLVADDNAAVIAPGDGLDDDDEEYNPLDEYSDDEWN